MERNSINSSNENNIFETNATNSTVNVVSNFSESQNSSIDVNTPSMTILNINRQGNPRTEFVNRTFIDFHNISQNISVLNSSIEERLKRNSTFRVLPDITRPQDVEAETSSVIFDDTDNKLKYYNGTQWVSNEGGGSDEITWEFLAYNWSEEPKTISTISSGDVYEYLLEGVTRYRLVPNPYEPTQDAFYSDFDGSNLTNLVVSRG